MPSATASGADKNGGSSAKSREHNQGNQDRKYTPEQKAAVIRVRKCAPTEFYEILAVEKTASDGQIKKAYRKLSLLTHPDKNGYDGSDEAFKSAFLTSPSATILRGIYSAALSAISCIVDRVDTSGSDSLTKFLIVVSRAFQILSDEEKKSKYDKFGGDPDNRFSGGASTSSPFSGFGGGGFPRPGGGRGPMYEEEISPEELFNRFFGGGGMGGMGGPFGKN